MTERTLLYKRVLKPGQNQNPKESGKMLTHICLFHVKLNQIDHSKHYSQYWYLLESEQRTIMLPSDWTAMPHLYKIHLPTHFSIISVELPKTNYTGCPKNCIIRFNCYTILSCLKILFCFMKLEVIGVVLNMKYLLAEK